MPTRSQDYICGGCGHLFEYLAHNREVPKLIVCPKCWSNGHGLHVEALDIGQGEVREDDGGPYREVILRSGTWPAGDTISVPRDRFATPCLSAVISKTVVRGNADFAQRERERLIRRMEEHNQTKDSIEEQVETAREVMKKATAGID